MSHSSADESCRAVDAGTKGSSGGECWRADRPRRCFALTGDGEWDGLGDGSGSARGGVIRSAGDGGQLGRFEFGDGRAIVIGHLSRLSATARTAQGRSKDDVLGVGFVVEWDGRSSSASERVGVGVALAGVLRGRLRRFGLSPGALVGADEPCEPCDEGSLRSPGVCDWDGWWRAVEILVAGDELRGWRLWVGLVDDRDMGAGTWEWCDER